MPEAETQACLTLSLIFSNRHSVYTQLLLLLVNTLSPLQLFGLVNLLQTYRILLLHIDVRCKDTETILFQQKRPFMFQ